MEAMLEDQANENSEKLNYNFQSSKNLTRHHTHHQVEYGAKKYIKPWRTGTKSQQIYTGSGHTQGSMGRSGGQNARSGK